MPPDFSYITFEIHFHFTNILSPFSKKHALNHVVLLYTVEFTNTHFDIFSFKRLPRRFSLKRYLFLTALYTIALQAQQTSPLPTDTVAAAGPWKHSVVSGLNMTQVALKDWAQGGESALSYAVSAYGRSIREDSVTLWTNTYKFTFGQARLGSQGLKKTDDKIDIESVISYKLRTFVDPYASLTLKSQFALGFTYDPETGAKTAVSKFFDPAYLTQTVGFGYQPVPQVKTRLGAGLREVITSQFNAYADDPTTNHVETIKIDGGFESVTNIDLDLDEGLVFTSKLELFAAFTALDEVIIRADNTIAAKFNKFISIILNMQIINDRRVTPRTQIKETLSLGISYTLI